MSTIEQAAVSFLSGFKIFFFHALAFLAFGSAFIFLSQSLCRDGWICNNYLGNLSFGINFENRIDVVKFLLFSYIVGLLLYAFSRLVFSKTLRGFFDKHIFKKKEYSNGEQKLNDIEILVYLESHPLVKDFYLMQLFYSFIVRLLFGFFAISTILFAPLLWLLGFMITGALFFLNLAADNEVQSLSGQIKPSGK